MTLPRWLRLLRLGTAVSAYSSPDGTSWQQLGTDTIALGAAAYVGMAITSRTNTASASATLSNVSVTSLALPSGQLAADVGAPAVQGSSFYRNGVYSMTAAGADIGGTLDQFRYVYQRVSGDVDIVARVASLERVRVNSKAGVMIRETLNPNARNATAVVTAAKGYSFQSRLDEGGPTDSVSGGTGALPGWVRLVRKGHTFEAFRSADGAAWTSMGSNTVAMADPVFVGLAVTSHYASRAATATFERVTIAQTASPNQPPTVSLTAPANGASFSAPATLAVAANASDPENRMARVEFYANTTRIGSVTVAPYAATWSAVPAGTYSLTAVATDQDGRSATSAAVTVDVAAFGQPLQFVVFQASADHAALVVSYRLDIYANGTSPGSGSPIASSNLGKPAPDSATNDISVDRAAFLSALAPGTYVATVSAIGAGGESRSAAITFAK